MYPLTCVAGYNVPARSGRFEVMGFTVTVEDETADSYFAIVDDPAIDQSGKAGLILSTLDYQKNVLAHIKGDGSAYDGTLEWHPVESIKTRYGLSLYYTNVKAGSVCVYVR